jgi:hypothetical protein
MVLSTGRHRKQPWACCVRELDAEAKRVLEAVGFNEAMLRAQVTVLSTA